MYQVLYRKWRPTTFSDVSGQDAITATLKNELKSGRLAHAYLFTGSRGTGKTSCAKILAKAVNCLHPVDGDPCNQCEICKGIDAGTIMDIEEIDAASNNGVDNIRALREEVHFTPTAGKYRVYIIDEVHMLSVGAFNALLKTLEEPPEHVIFVLATTEVHKVPATVLSRCQRFDFQRISDHAIAARLLYVAKQEQFVLEKPAADLIARLADGGMRDALSILDRCAGVETVSVERVNEIVGLASNDRLFDISAAIGAGQIGEALKAVEQLHRQSSDMMRLCDQLITHFRNIMLAKAVPNPAELIVCSPEDLRRTMNCSEGFTMEQILAVLTALQAARERMRGAVNQRVELEMALIRLMAPAAIEASSVVINQPTGEPAKPQRVIPEKQETVIQDIKQQKKPIDLPWREDSDEIRRSEAAADQYREEIPPPFTDEDCPPEEIVESSVSGLQKPPAAAAPATKPVSVQSSDREGLPYFTPWAQVIETLAAKNRLMASVLKGSDAYLKDDIVLIRSEHPQFADLLRQPQNRTAVRDAIEAVTGKTHRLGPYKTEQKAAEDPLQAFVRKLQGKVEIHDLDAPGSEPASQD